MKIIYYKTNNICVKKVIYISKRYNAKIIFSIKKSKTLKG